MNFRSGTNAFQKRKVVENTEDSLGTLYKPRPSDGVLRRWSS